MLEAFWVSFISLQILARPESCSERCLRPASREAVRFSTMPTTAPSSAMAAEEAPPPSPSTELPADSSLSSLLSAEFGDLSPAAMAMDSRLEGGFDLRPERGEPLDGVGASGSQVEPDLAACLARYFCSRSSALITRAMWHNSRMKEIRILAFRMIWRSLGKMSSTSFKSSRSRHSTCTKLRATATVGSMCCSESIRKSVLRHAPFEYTLPLRRARPLFAMRYSVNGMSIDSCGA
mmetsp:Transcript_9203/g.20791  ORF Transcript_9203/g.20791 Transcript_9203/m.20791 type:complete len:235 (+) Transcript_9203:291-995(+)